MTFRDLADSLDRNEQLDGILLDFSKTFDKVPHLWKLSYYRDRGNIPSSIKDFLTNPKQEVVLEGKNSSRSAETVFGQLLFLIFINDITNNILSTARLFADECVLYRTIHCEADATTLQTNLGSMQQLEAKWLMEFNLDQCEVVTVAYKCHI
jgi:hypothetical protein